MIKKKEYKNMIIEGKAFWAKILKPVDNYSKDGQEYTLDLVVDEENLEKFRSMEFTSGEKPKVNRNGKEHISEEDYIQFRRPTKTRGGEPIRAPEIVDRFGNEWDSEELIGNGSVVRVMIGEREGDFNGVKWKKATMFKIQVWEHVPVETEQFEYDAGTQMNDSTESTEETWTD